MSDLRMLRLPEVLNKTGLSRSGLYERIANGGFPEQVPLGGRLVAWVEDEVNEWLLERISLRKT